MNRKYLVITVLSIALIISSITNVVIILTYPKDSNPEDQSTLVVGTSAGPDTLDIVDVWDSASIDVLEQVVETLFSHDLRDPNLPRINLLAESYYWKNKTTLQIKLREDILFHDGTPFNSIAAKWNLDRLLYLTNCTGNNTGITAQTRSLWMRPDGKTPIINNVEPIGKYNITITLNGPYGPFLNLLTYINSGMISPTAHNANVHGFIPLDSKIVGTGPFVFEHYTPRVEVVLTRWNSYRENLAYFSVLKFKLFNDPDKANEEMLDRKIDFNLMARPADILAYEAREGITVKNFTDDTGLPSLIYQYINFNCKRLNQTWRRAMSYAVNYTYIIDVLRQGKDQRANSPISPGFGLSYNESAKAPNYNITKARELMVLMGFGDMGWSEQQWIEHNFRTVRYTYNAGNTFRQDLGVSLEASFKLIGVSVELEIWYPWDPWGPWYSEGDPMIYYYEHLDLTATGWAPDYLEPYSMLDPLFNPISISNIAFVNDSKLNTMMALALETTNDTSRNIIYKDIQGYLTETCFHVPLYHSEVILVHSMDLRNVPYNAIGKFQAYGTWRV